MEERHQDQKKILLIAANKKDKVKDLQKEIIKESDNVERIVENCEDLVQGEKMREELRPNGLDHIRETNKSQKMEDARKEGIQSGITCVNNVDRWGDQDAWEYPHTFNNFDVEIASGPFKEKEQPCQ